MDVSPVITLAVSALVGSVGFALFFNVNPRHVPIASLGGVLTWFIYWLLYQHMGQIFVPCVLACTFAALYSEVVARLCKVPTTVFFIISAIVLVPGRSLFLTMSDAVNGRMDSFTVNAENTLMFVAGIAAGLCIVTAAVQTWKYIHERLRRLRRAALEKVQSFHRR